MREDWIECELGDLLKLKNGFAFKASNYKKEGIPVFRIGDINDWIVSAKNAVKIEEKQIYDDFIVENGDILIAMSGATTGKFGIYNSTEKAYQNQRVGNLKLYSENVLNKNFIFYLLYSLKRDIERDAYGGAQPNISGIKIEALKTKLAPLPIQRAIVSKIEALFSDLDNGIANFKKAQEQLKIYRQAVLKKAFEGFSTLTTVGDEFDFVGGGTPSKANSDYWNGDLFWCSVKDVKGDYLHKTIDKITRKGLKESASNLGQPEEVILITRISPGKTIISKVETAINQDLKVVKPKRDYLPKLIHYLFQAYEREIIKLSSGTTVLGINLTNLKSIEIPLCSTQEQIQIVQEIESRLSVCDKMEQSISESIEKAEALRQSILKKAFEGKLLSQAEIELCKQAADYEPASELLKKIQAEKLAKEQEKKKKPTVKKKSKQ